MRNWTLAAIVLGAWGGPTLAQLSIAPTTPDLSGYVTTSQLNSTIQNATPAPCPILQPDTLTGSVGTASPCMPRQDSTRPTVVQATTVTTNSDGLFSGTWPVPFATTPTFRSAQVEVTSAQTPPIDCSFIAGTVTATGFSGKCSQLASTTLPTVTTALLGLVISPIVNAAGGQTVRIVGRQ